MAARRSEATKGDAGAPVIGADAGGRMDAGESSRDSGGEDGGSATRDASTRDGSAMRDAFVGADGGESRDAGRPMVPDAGSCSGATPTLALSNDGCTSGGGDVVAITRVLGQSFLAPRDGALRGIEVARAGSLTNPLPDTAALGIAVCEGATGRCTSFPSGPRPLATGYVLRGAVEERFCDSGPFSGDAPGTGYFDFTRDGCPELRGGTMYRFGLFGGVRCDTSRHACTGTAIFCNTDDDCGWGLLGSATDGYTDGSKLASGDPTSGDLVFRIFYAP